MSRKQRILTIGVAAALLCVSLAYGYWIDTIALQCRMPVLYPAEITLEQEAPPPVQAAPLPAEPAAPGPQEAAPAPSPAAPTPEEGAQTPTAPAEPEDQLTSDAPGSDAPAADAAEAAEAAAQ